MDMVAHLVGNAKDGVLATKCVERRTQVKSGVCKKQNVIKTENDDQV